MTGIEFGAGIDIALGQVTSRLDRLGDGLESLREDQFIPQRGQHSEPFKNTPSTCLVIGDEPPAGRIWNIVSVGVVIRQPTGVSHNEFDATGTAAVYIGDANSLVRGAAVNAANPVGGSGQGYIFGSIPNTGADLIAGPWTLGTTNTQSLSRNTYWCRQNQTPYVLFRNTTNIATAFEVQLIWWYLDYAEEDILPRAVYGRGGVRKRQFMNTPQLPVS